MEVASQCRGVGVAGYDVLARGRGARRMIKREGIEAEWCCCVNEVVLHVNDRV